MEMQQDPPVGPLVPQNLVQNAGMGPDPIQQDKVWGEWAAPQQQ